MKSCCDFFLKKSKLKKTNEIDNLNISSSKLEINKTPTLKINSNQYHKDTTLVKIWKELPHLQQ